MFVSFQFFVFLPVGKTVVAFRPAEENFNAAIARLHFQVCTLFPQ